MSFDTCLSYSIHTTRLSPVDKRSKAVATLQLRGFRIANASTSIA